MFGQAEVTDTQPMGIPFHLRERSMEGALLSCWLYCMDIGFHFFVLGSVGLRFWPGQAVSLLFLFSCLPVRLAWLLCLCRPPWSSSSSPAGWFVPSRAPGATQCAVFIGVGSSSRPWDSIGYVCVCACVRSRVPWPWFLLSVSFVFGLLSVSVAGGCRRRRLCCLVVLLRASAVAHTLVCVQLSYVYSECRSVIGCRVKLYLHGWYVQSGLVCTSSVLM